MKYKICGFDRYVEKCHIIPKSLGGNLSEENSFFLCPNHHRLLDNGLLTNEEMVAVEEKIINLTNNPKVKENMEQLEHLYFLLRLTDKPKFWCPDGINILEMKLKKQKEVPYF